MSKEKNTGFSFREILLTVYSDFDKPLDENGNITDEFLEYIRNQEPILPIFRGCKKKEV